ncbi:hypothetical protein ACT4S5_13160 [Kocuria oceani]|uniref:hypothetical protein n=1 Tax=Kocuria oceani TaxID=988827 RepID=UPI0040371C41
MSGAAPHTTADYYLALAELSAYRATAQAAAVDEIAADQFGIHADPATGQRLQERAAQLVRADTAGAQLDQLSRLERRVRGVFYDGHRDRITAWDSSGEDLQLYTCTGAELRAAAAAAVDYGDLTVPVMRHQVVTDTYLPTGAEDPALVLAVTAEQLGRQAARTVRHGSAATAGPETAPTPRPGAGPAPADATRTVSASTWVQPVSGDWGELVVGQLDAAYTRHTPGARSRSATVVREHKRRAPGTAADAAPTITVRSHPRRGTGPEAPTPKVTRVSGRGRLWR